MGAVSWSGAAGRNAGPGGRADMGDSADIAGTGAVRKKGELTEPSFGTVFSCCGQSAGS